MVYGRIAALTNLVLTTTIINNKR